MVIILVVFNYSDPKFKYWCFAPNPTGKGLAPSLFHPINYKKIFQESKEDNLPRQMIMAHKEV
jgi:hypothetical protein